jgi:1,4-dihydroxy-2-naphthoate octaprenyltransferase
MSDQNNSLSKFEIWMLAARPKTLPAAAASAILGSALALHDGKFHLLPAIIALIISILLQVGANFANDLFDFQRGADAPDRLGPLRVTQAGLLTPRQVTNGIILVIGVSTSLGIYLAINSGWLVILIGIFAIVAALTYTGGPFPFGYHSLGDLFVLIFFGFAAVCGTYFVQAGSISSASIWGGLAMGLLITNILVVNNLRDIDSDRLANKRTLAVRMGIRWTRVEYSLFVLIAYVLPVILVIDTNTYLGSFLTWFSIPYAISLIKEIYQVEGRSLNKTLAGTARLALIYSLLFSTGILFLNFF